MHVDATIHQPTNDGRVAMTDGTDNAFAMPAVTGFPNGEVMWGAQGLTKRELFAAMAMQGIVANTSMIDDLNDSAVKWAAKRAVQQADALIEALNERKEQP